MLTNSISTKSQWIVGLIFIVVLATPAIALSANIYVDINNNSGIEDGTIGNPFNSIQEGINNANQGDTIRVLPGTYIESLTINGLSIKLLGSDPSNTTIQGTGANVIDVSGIFSVGSDTVEIAGLTITGGATNGIRLYSSSLNAIVHNNVILGNGYGLYAYSGSDAVIYNNTITSNSLTGVYATGADTVLTAHNNIVVNNDRYGIYAGSYSYVTSAYNNVWSNSSGDHDNYGTATLNQSNNTSIDPQFIGNFYLAATSGCIDSGRPIAADNDPDGTRNDQGVYGGPFAVDYWPQPAGGPVVTDLSVTPPSVPVGGTLTIRATGKIR